MPFKLKYHPAVKNDINLLDNKQKSRIKSAIEKRLLDEPHKYGVQLRKTLKGYWKLRIGDYRVVFKIQSNFIIILAILHRSYVYTAVKKRA